MLITFNQLRRDTYYFVTQQAGAIIFISIIMAFIYQFINVLTQPNINILSIINSKIFNNTNEIFNFIDHMSFKKQQELLKCLILQILQCVTYKTLLLGSIITLLTTLSDEKKKHITFSMCDYVKFLPRLFLLNLLLFFIIQIGLIFFILPGIILFILLFLSPIILSFKKHNIINSIYYSVYFSWKYLAIIISGITCWMLAKYFVIFLLSNIIINKNFLCLIFNISYNVLYCIVTAYFFRFYMLINPFNKV